jgi:hypothetical protein
MAEMEMTILNGDLKGALLWDSVNLRGPENDRPRGSNTSNRRTVL